MPYMAYNGNTKNHPSFSFASSSSLVLTFVTLLCALSFGVGQGRVPFACDPKNGLTRSLKFCRTHVPVHARVQDLIGRLTLQEKIRLLVNNAIAIPRLGIQGYEWWSEALHGVSNVGPGTKFGGAFPGATSFPQVITTAASFNESLWQEIGQVRFPLQNIKLFVYPFIIETSFVSFSLFTPYVCFFTFWSLG